MSTTPKAPAFQFYARDWIADTRELGVIGRGILIDMIALCWENGSIADDPAVVAMAVGADVATVVERWLHLRSKFVAHPVEQGRIVNRRLEIERGKQADYRSRQSAAGKASAQQRLNRGSTVVATVVQPEGQPKPKSASASASADFKDLAAGGAAADVGSREQGQPKRKGGRKRKDPDAVPELPLVCTKAQFTATIAAASGGRYLDTPVGEGGSFKLNPLLRDPDALKKAAAIGRWLAAGGDGFKGTLDGRHFGPNIDAWLAHATAKPASTSAPGFRHESTRPYQPPPVVEDDPVRRTKTWTDAVKVAVGRGMSNEDAMAYADDIARRAIDARPSA